MTDSECMWLSRSIMTASPRLSRLQACCMNRLCSHRFISAMVLISVCFKSTGRHRIMRRRTLSCTDPFSHGASVTVAAVTSPSIKLMPLSCARSFENDVMLM